MSNAADGDKLFTLSYLHGALKSHAAQIDKLWDAELRTLQNGEVSSTTEGTYEDFQSEACVRRASEALTSDISKSTNYRRSYTYNGQQTSLRIIDVLETSRLTLVLDEAQRLWPQRSRSAQTPMRLLWLTTLVNAGVPVGLVALPEFFRLQRALVKASGWSDAQFNRRLAMVKELPTQLGEEDLRRVARHYLPEGGASCHELLVRYAQASKVNLSAITEPLRAARFLARKSNHAEVTFTDLQDAVAQIRAPMDWLLAADPAQLCADA